MEKKNLPGKATTIIVIVIGNNKLGGNKTETNTRYHNNINQSNKQYPQQSVEVGDIYIYIYNNTNFCIIAMLCFDFYTPDGPPGNPRWVPPGWNIEILL